MQTQKPALLDWILFTILCLIWGTSFLLMMEGLKIEGTAGANGWWQHKNNEGILASLQVAALRMLGAGIVLLPLAINAFKRVKGKALSTTIISGYLGSLLPALFFCLAETKLDSSFAGMLNSMTPLFVLLVGQIIYKAKIPNNKVLGIIIGFVGSIILIVAYFLKGKQALAEGQSSSSYIFVLLIIAATLLYGLNVNMVGHNLGKVHSNDIATIAFVCLIPPALIILFATGFFNHNFSDPNILNATIYSLALGVVGTAFASILFYILVKRSGFVFASLVTYGIPFVAIAVGYLRFGEQTTIWQVAGLVVILIGVYLANKIAKA
jgi:drug/metabolite transporter (DMT)-like permease